MMYSKVQLRKVERTGTFAQQVAGLNCLNTFSQFKLSETEVFGSPSCFFAVSIYRMNGKKKFEDGAACCKTTQANLYLGLLCT